MVAIIKPKKEDTESSHDSSQSSDVDYGALYREALANVRSYEHENKMENSFVPDPLGITDDMTEIHKRRARVHNKMQRRLKKKLRILNENVKIEA